MNSRITFLAVFTGLSVFAAYAYNYWLTQRLPVAESLGLIAGIYLLVGLGWLYLIPQAEEED